MTVMTVSLFFPRQAARCATAHRPPIHGALSACLMPRFGWRKRVPRSRRRPVSGHRASDGAVARCKSADVARVGFRIGDAVIGLEIDFLVLDRLPQPFDKDLVPPGPLAIQADLDAVRLEHPREFAAGERATLVGIGDLRATVPVDGFPDRVQTEVGGGCWTAARRAPAASTRRSRRTGRGSPGASGCR